MKKKTFRIKNLLLMIAMFLAISLIIYLSTEPLYTPTAFASPHQKLVLPQFIAHKSLVSNQSRGNTKEALIQALDTSIEGIELDVRLSKDKVPFIFHSDLLEEIAQARGLPEEKTWAELEQIKYLPLTANTDPQNVDSTIMSLEEVFKRVGSSKYLFLDVKDKDIWNNGFAESLAKLIEKYQLYETVIIESLNPFFLIWMRLQTRDILIMYDFTTNVEAEGEELQNQFNQIPWLLRQTFIQKQFRRILRPDLLGPRWNIDQSLMQHLIQSEYPIIAWTVDDPDVAKKLFTLGVQGIETNKPLVIEANFNTSFQTLKDAGGTESLVAKKIYVTQEQQIIEALAYAKKK